MMLRRGRAVVPFVSSANLFELLLDFFGLVVLGCASAIVCTTESSATPMRGHPRWRLISL